LDDWIYFIEMVNLPPYDVRRECVCLLYNVLFGYIWRLLFETID